MSKATLEGMLVGVSKNLINLSQKTPQDIKEIYNSYRHLEEFSTDNLKEGLSAKDKVQTRLHSAIQVFSN